MLGIVGMNMLKEGQKPSRKVISITTGGEIDLDEPVDFGLVPLGMPMLAGPGSITLVILMGTTNGIATVALAIIIVMAFSMSMFWIASSMKNSIGENSTRVFTRIMGLLIVTTAVQYFLDGMKMWIITL